MIKLIIFLILLPCMAMAQKLNTDGIPQRALSPKNDRMVTVYDGSYHEIQIPADITIVGDDLDRSNLKSSIDSIVDDAIRVSRRYAGIASSFTPEKVTLGNSAGDVKTCSVWVYFNHKNQFNADLNGIVLLHYSKKKNNWKMTFEKYMGD